MKTVELRACAMHDLSQRYSREVGPRKLVIYKVSAGHLFSDTPAVETIKQYIKTREGEDIEFKVIQAATGGSKEDKQDLTPVILNDRVGKKIKKALLKTLSTGTLYSRHVVIKWPMLSKILCKIVDLFNGLIVHKYNNALINKFNLRSQVTFVDLGRNLGLNNTEKKLMEPFQYPNFDYIRHIDPVQYLVVAGLASQIEEVVLALKADLKLLTEKNLIIGHFAMPSLIMLANSSGIPENTFAAYCFFIPDTVRIFKLYEKAHPLKDGQGRITPDTTIFLKELGVKYLAREGEINWLNGLDPASLYSIEEVDVDQIQNHEAVIEAYESSRDKVNEVSEQAAALYEVTNQNPDLRESILELQRMLRIQQ